MSDKIKPSEVSEVLQQQLQEVNGSQQFDEVGTVLTVSDGVARIYGLRNAEANMSVSIVERCRIGRW